MRDVEISEWWTADPGQRFWMEITDRVDLGADLFAPTTDKGGRPYWGYELVTYVQAGDVVLHWHKELGPEPAVVGWSQATGAYEDTDISWQARAAPTDARERERKGSLTAPCVADAASEFHSAHRPNPAGRGTRPGGSASPG